MRSRSALEPAGVALGAAAEGIWSGCLAAALTGASAAALTVFAGVTVLAAAQVARRFGAGHGRERVARLLAMTLVLVAAAMLLVAGRAWAHPSPLWLVARDVVYAGGLVALGLNLGSDPPSPEAAVRRAVRGFALLGAVLLVAALVHATPGWAPWAVVAALVVGGLLVAIVRYQTLTDLVDPLERLPAWPWLLAVVGAVLVVIALGALLSQVLRVDALLWALAVVAGVLRYALLVAAYLVGYAGAGLVRGLAWLLGALHVSGWHPVLRPHPVPTQAVLPRRDAHDLKVWSGSRLMFTGVGALVALGLSFALVALALRRFRRRPPAEVMVIEEREALASLTSAAGAFAARRGRRLRRRRPTRRSEPRTPAELVRRRYAELEQRLARAGRPRPTGTTVRDHLTSVTVAPSGPPDGAAAPPQAAADLAAVYELARYSARSVEAAQAHRFEALARAFVVRPTSIDSPGPASEASERAARPPG